MTWKKKLRGSVPSAQHAKLARALADTARSLQLGFKVARADVDTMQAEIARLEKNLRVVRKREQVHRKIIESVRNVLNLPHVLDKSRGKGRHVPIRVTEATVAEQVKRLDGVLSSMPKRVRPEEGPPGDVQEEREARGPPRLPRAA